MKTIYEDAQRAWDNLNPEDYEPPDKCPDCLQIKCVCDGGNDND